MLDIAATCLVVTALLAYANHRFIGLPTSIGVMVSALGLSLLLVALDALGLAYGVRAYEESLLRSIDFSNVLMQGMLSLLLFAGALHVDLSELKSLRWPVASLALIGTLVSTLMVGYGLWVALPWVGLTLPLMSFGGTAILVNLVAIAVVLRIDIESRQLMHGGRA